MARMVALAHRLDELVRSGAARDHAELALWDTFRPLAFANS
jgi:hypothetical protein